VADIPQAVLSEHFQERMKGRRILSAVFLTYQFEPGFFEQEVLPVLLDIPLSHSVPIRLVQLEDALKELKGEIAVYYDANGLVVGDAGSARLDVRRIPVRHHTGIFHPKNVLLLTESEEADTDSHCRRTLVITSMSANLTRAGWWENVEACHVEEVNEGDKTRLRDDLAAFLERLRHKLPVAGGHTALREILAFLRQVSPRLVKSTAGILHTHFYGGSEAVPDFLERTAGGLLRGAYLEVISPYFDDAASCAPLEALIDRFQPKEVRVFLPRSRSGEGLCQPKLYDAVRTLPHVHWGRLDKDILRLGRGDDARERFVHAKVYRFFTQNPKREICFVGSANLTSPGHSTGGNVETGFLVDMTPHRRPEFWMSPHDQRPTEFKVRKEDDASAASGGTRLNLRYHWDRVEAEAYWDSAATSPALRIEARGIAVGVIPPLSPRAWTVLPADVTGRVAQLLSETSLFFVHGEGEEPALLLVQEEGMSHKPSLLMSLSATDILKYWSLLTPEQRSAFLEARAPEVFLIGQGADLVTSAKVALGEETLFDRFAGFFHAFGCLERTCRSALEAGREKEVGYRLFGKKYDSLASLLDRVSSDEAGGDDVDRYVIVLCARQLCREIARDHPEYWHAHGADARELDQKFQDSAAVRQRLVEQKPGEMSAFLYWFDRWFLRRAVPPEEVPQ
jgi:hypothetical protein